MDPLESEGYRIEGMVLGDNWGELLDAVYLPHQYRVTLRRFPAELSENREAWELARAEIQAWARLSHPGVLQVLDWGMAGRFPYLVTERPKGKPLDRCLGDRDSRIDADQVFTSLLASIEAARCWGVAHLGLCPTNVWVTSDNRVQVGDFGLWYVSRDFPPLGHRDDVFLAPEQREGSRVSPATDVYTLAVIYLVLKCGLRKVEEALSGGSFPAGLPNKRDVLEKCLDPRLLARHQSAGVLADALQLGAENTARPACRDCPICRLKSEIEEDAAMSAAAGTWPAALSKLAWVAIAVLGAVALLLWLVLLR